MGMDVYGKNGNYFRANVWQWRAMIYTMELAEYNVPENWHYNDGYGLRNQKECDLLVEHLEKYLSICQADVIVWETKTSMRVDDKGYFVKPNTPNSQSAYSVHRKQLEGFVEFLKVCDGFEIC